MLPDSESSIILAEQRVMLHVAGNTINSLMDMGAAFSHSGPTVPLPVSVMEVEGTSSFQPKTLPFPCSLAGQLFSSSFLVISVCVPLLGHDILSHFGATISLVTIPPLDTCLLFPWLTHRSLLQTALSLSSWIQLAPKSEIRPPR